jgi:hypothetical protein
MVRRTLFLSWMLLGASIAGPAAAQQVPLRQLLAAGYEVKAVNHLTISAANEVAANTNQPIALVTLQKGGSLVVCWFAFANYMNLADVMLDSQRACDVRGTQTKAFEFSGPSHTGLIGTWRLDTRNGQIAWCQFERPAGSDGVTACSTPTEAVGNDAGPFQLISHRRPDDNSVQRVSLATGMVSICFVQIDAGRTRVACTAAR